jgi:GxxExxY protein
LEAVNRQDAKDAKEDKDKRRRGRAVELDPELMEPEDEVDRLAHAVIGAAIEVHRLLGPGHLEAVYQKAMEVELGLRSIPFAFQRPVDVAYKGQPVGQGLIDIFVADCLVVELKAVDKLAPIHKPRSFRTSKRRAAASGS